MEYTIGTQVFGGWEITRELGEGSYGKVFELQRTGYGFTAKSALKLIRIPKSPSEIREALSEGMDERSVTSYFEEIVSRFVHEIAVMSELKGHPNIVSCEDYMVQPHPGTVGWDILIRMELLTSLQDYQLQSPMTEQTVCRLAKDLCEALVFCQKKGLIHRDIKPGNVFVDTMGRFKLGDFGVARTAEKTMGGMSKQGTENYMAPEVYFGRPYGASVDIYSLGLMLYRLMNGNRLPFYPPAPARIGLSDRENALKKRMDGELMPPPRDASPEFAMIILKACAHDPKERYRTAAEMLEALEGRKAAAETPSVKRGILPEDEEDRTVSIFSGRSGTDEEEEDRTVSIFGGKSGTCEEEDDRTVSIFGNRNKDPEEDDRTVGPFGREEKKPPVPKQLDVHKSLDYTEPDNPAGKTVTVRVGNRRVPVEVPEDLRSGQILMVQGQGKPDPDTGRRGDLYVQIHIKPAPAQTDREYLVEFWKKNLTDLWQGNRAQVWKAYFAPDIPLQICSNAIFNITDREVGKDQILAILDCTPDIRIPCGAGIVVTENKMYIRLNSASLTVNAVPKAVIDLDRLKRMWIGEEKVLWTRTPVLCWETQDRKAYTYGKNTMKCINYNALIRILNSREWLDRKKLP